MRLSHGGPHERLVGAVLVGGIDVDTRGGQLHLIISLTISAAGPVRRHVFLVRGRNRNHPRIGGRVVHSFTVVARGGYYQDPRVLRRTHGRRKIIRPLLAPRLMLMTWMSSSALSEAVGSWVPIAQ